MTAKDWYLALFSLGAGASIPVFWAVAVSAGRYRSLRGDRRDFRFHIGAELLTGALLVTGGAGILGAGDAAWVRPTLALGLGALVYSLIESPGHYLAVGRRRIVAALAGTWVLAVPALVLVIAG